MQRSEEEIVGALIGPRLGYSTQPNAFPMKPGVGKGVTLIGPQSPPQVIGDLPGFGEKFSGGHGNARIVLMHDVLGGQPWLAPWLEVGH